jgi:hypothetical protein
MVSNEQSVSVTSVWRDSDNHYVWAHMGLWAVTGREVYVTKMNFQKQVSFLRGETTSVTTLLIMIRESARTLPPTFGFFVFWGDVTTDICVCLFLSSTLIKTVAALPGHRGNCPLRARRSLGPLLCVPFSFQNSCSDLTWRLHSAVFAIRHDEETEINFG